MKKISVVVTGYLMKYFMHLVKALVASLLCALLSKGYYMIFMGGNNCSVDNKRNV